MKKQIAVFSLVLTLTGLVAAAASAATLDAGLIRTSGVPAVSDGKFYGYRTVSEGPGDAAFSDALALARAEHAPLVAIWSNEDCHYCDAFAEDLNDNAKAVTDWLSTNRAVCVYFKDMSGDYPPTKGHKPAACYDAYDFVYTTCGSRPVWPLVGFYYEKWDGTEVKWSHDNVGLKTFAWLRKNYGTWCAKNGIGNEASVYFATGTTPADRLEAVPGMTAAVSVPVRRRSASKMEMVVCRSAFSDGTTIDLPVLFEIGSFLPTADVCVPLTNGVHLSGEKVLLSLVADQKTVAECSITFVEEAEITPKNPCWIGERDAVTLAPGEWTMDRDLALEKAEMSGGSTLTLIGGSLWCPDCVNADAYLVDTDVFKHWATNSGVYCAAVDVPSFPKNGETCLLTYSSTAVSDRYVNATIPPQERVQSGSGYLSRKMIPQTENGGTNATAVLARNLNLATNSVANGGLCRPECLDDWNTETGRWKTGVPCFVMQSAGGRVTGRLFQFSNVSPTNSVAASAYVQRLEELRALADDTTEEVNRHWMTATTPDCAMSLRDGVVVSTISAIDTSDFWRVADRERWMRVGFALKATEGTWKDPEDDVRLSLWRKSGDGAEKIAAVSGSLSSGLMLADQEISADTNVDYFVQVEAIETSAAFALDHAGDSVVRYALTPTVSEDPGEVSFVREGDTVYEAEAEKAGGRLRVFIPLVRTGGASGLRCARISVDREMTTAFPDRYSLVTNVITWADGEFGEKGCPVDIFDDGNADGTQELVLVCDDSVYTLTIVDNDKSAVGKLALTSIAPAMAKRGWAVAEESSVVTVGVSRVGGASGAVGCKLAVTAGQFLDEPEFVWQSRESGLKALALRLPALEDCLQGKVTVSFSELTDVRVDTSARILTVQLAAHDAPRFDVSEKILDLAKYCLCSQDVAIVNLSEGATARVVKLSGALPTGLTPKLTNERLIITGIPTRVGTYESVYQVSQTCRRKTTVGLTVRFVFTVTDVATLDPSAPGANPSVATSRTFTGVPVVNSPAHRMTGILASLTLPPTGRCSARYMCSDGNITLSSPSWMSYDATTGELRARLCATRKTHALDVRAFADGTVGIVLYDPAFDGATLEAEVSDGWSASDPATDWMGYYTAVADAPDPATLKGTLFAAGNPVLAMKMSTIAMAKRGIMSYAGVLPNGQSFSGSATLVRRTIDAVQLPVCYRTLRDFLTLAPQIASGAPKKAVTGMDILSWWRHVEAITNASYEVCYTRVAGSYYDATVDLRETLSPTAQEHAFTAANAIDPILVAVSKKTVTLDPVEARDASARMTFNKTTGMIHGSFRTVTSAGKVVTASYKGVLLPDWGDGCPSCGDMPWASGAFWFSDTIDCDSAGRVRSIAIKRGDVIYIESR